MYYLCASEICNKTNLPEEQIIFYFYNLFFAEVPLKAIVNMHLEKELSD